MARYNLQIVVILLLQGIVMPAIHALLGEATDNMDI